MSKENGKNLSGMVFIPGNVPSLKNSKIKTSRGIFASKTVNSYIRGLGIQHFSSSRKEVIGYKDPERPNIIEGLRAQFEAMKKGKKYPIIIGYHFVRNSKRKFDFSNSVEVIQDLLTAHGIIEDDNVEFVFPIPMTDKGNIPNINTREYNFYSIDKENPGVYLKFF